MTMTQDGVGYRLYFQKLVGISDWSVVVQVPTTFFTQPVNSLIWRLILVAAIAFPACLWLGSWFASTIALPIPLLNSTTSFVEGPGRSHSQAEVATTDELGETEHHLTK